MRSPCDIHFRLQINILNGPIRSITDTHAFTRCQWKKHLIHLRKKHGGELLKIYGVMI